MYKLFHGDDNFISLQEAKKFVDEIRTQHTEFEFITIDADSLEVDNIAEKYKISGMFSTSKIIFIKRLYQNKKKEIIIEDLMTLLPAEGEVNHFILWEDQKVPATTRYLKFFKKQNALSENNKANKKSFSGWAVQAIKDVNLEFADNSVIGMLSEFANYSTERFHNELLKLKLAGKTKVSKEDILANSPQTYEHDIWEFVGLLGDVNKKDQAVIVINKLIQQKVDPYYLLSMITRNYRILLQAKYLDSNNYSTKEMASILRVPPFILPSTLSAARSYTQEKAELLYNKIYNLEYEMKTGRIEPNLGLILLTNFI